MVISRLEVMKILRKIYLLLIWSSLLSSITSTAQSIDAIKRAYADAGMHVAVLTNPKNYIPIQHLDKTKAAYIGGSFNSTGLTEYLHHYQQIPLIGFHYFKDDTWDRSFNLLMLDIDFNKTSTDDLVILSAEIEKQNTAYLVILNHASTGILPPNLFPSASATICTWGDSEYLPHHVAQIIYGAENSIGKLPFFLNHEYRSGHGLETTGIYRLRYGPPELVDIEGERFQYALQLQVEDAIREGVFPGANLLVAKDGIVIYNEAFGKNKYDDSASLTQDEMYDLASITKIFSATISSMWLHSHGQFDPDKTLSHYWPYLKRSNKTDLIWKDVLTHRARLQASIVYYKHVLNSKNQFLPRTLRSMYKARYSIPVTESWYANKNIPGKILKTIKETPLLSMENYVYSDLSMIMLGKTIEEISKMPLNKFVQKKFYQSLGADNTTYLPMHSFTKDQLVPTEVDTIFRKELIRGYVHDENASLLGGISGHAGLFSNANDMAKIAQMLLNKGSYGGIEYIKPETIQLYTRYQYPELGNRRGLGFDKPLLKYDVNQAHTARDASDESFGHSGFTGTFVWMDPKYNLTYILLTNRVYPTRANNKISQYSIRPCIQQTIYDHMLHAMQSKSLSIVR